MTNKDLAVGFNKVFYAINNIGGETFTAINFYTGERETKVLPKWFSAFDSGLVQHLADKWEESGDFFTFYSQLDGGTRFKLLSWINENYQLSEDFGLEF